MGSTQLVSVDFEVSGKVQGVCFRAYTKQEADRLDLKGWCMNTYGGTVKGQLEGTKENIEEMKSWLRSTGSPSSRIQNAQFTNEKNVEVTTHKSFSILRSPPAKNYLLSFFIPCL